MGTHRRVRGRFEIMTATPEDETPEDENGTTGSVQPMGLDRWTGDWVLEPGRSSLRFRSTAMWGLMKVDGRFTELSGEGSIRPDGTATGRLDVSTASVDTGKAKRDRHLRSDELLDADAHPTISYALRSVQLDGPGHLHVSGDLHVAGQTHPLDLAATIDEDPPASVVVAVRTEIDRSQWGVAFKKMGMTKMATQVEARLVWSRTR